MRIETIQYISAAHHLPKHKGACKNMHGHLWVIKIIAEGEPNEENMLFDFGLIKGQLDHKLINDIIPNPTAENITLWVKDQLINANPKLIYIDVSVWEDVKALIDVGRIYRNEGEHINESWFWSSKKKEWEAYPCE